MPKNVSQYKELEKPIIFIGNPRSGTSVISEIVMRHEDIGFPSQYQNAFKKKTSINLLRRLFDNGLWRIFGQKRQLNSVSLLNDIVFRTSENYPMWNDIVENHIDFARGFLLDTKAGVESVMFIRKFFSQIVRYQGKRRLAFKITGPSRIEYLSSIFPDAQFIRIHRKPVPTVSSLMKVKFWGPLGERRLWWTGPYSEHEKQWAAEHKDDPIALTAFQTKKIIDVTDAEIAKTKVDVLDVQYSDFVRNPEDTVKKILDYVGLHHDKSVFDYFSKNKIYDQNKKDEDYFGPEDLATIRQVYSEQV